MTDVHELLARDVLEVLGHAVIATDMTGTVVLWNDAAEALYGWSSAEAVGRPISELTVPEPMQDLAAEIMADLAAGRAWSGVFTVRRKDGSTFTALVTDTALRDADGQLVAVVGVSLNFAQVVRPFVSRTREAVISTDRAGIVRLASPAIVTLLGWREEQLVGESWWDYVHPDDRDAARAAHAAVAATKDQMPPAEARVRCSDDSWLWVDSSATNMLAEPIVRGVMLTLRDVSDRHAMLEELAARAARDSLTGLVNRAAFMDRLTTLLTRRAHCGVMLFLDLDDFKSVNDQYGHVAGDAVLRAVAERLVRSARPEDACARLGGDEFAVLAENISRPEDADAFVRRISAALSEPVTVGTAAIRPRASIGFALLGENRSADQVMQLADEAMYRQK
ncbi:sensor domain-containing diguanylate cyclase [Pengzhenrongella frigida]|uniref:Sensor domain-containing diguanylate cyclase n=1 Tax=Pengzhenrongella frigida TaxID=1259133 RepID=A0A4Q5N3K8_9MICO|nr:sensor domain-containing diguanylate cyclase [Cellulomonas sp. HLT2-17]RYV51843.1 sensor domain-containing diguanylate cyclase [Cellulomonas sp. HLT2-17]